MGLFGKKKVETRSQRTLSEAFFFVVEDRRPGHEKTFTPEPPSSRANKTRDRDNYSASSASSRDTYDAYDEYAEEEYDEYEDEREYSAPVSKPRAPKPRSSPKPKPKPRGPKPSKPSVSRGAKPLSKPRGPKPAGRSGRSRKPEVRTRKAADTSDSSTSNKAKDLERTYKSLRSEYETAKENNELQLALDLKRDLKKFPLEIDDAIEDLRAKYKRIRDTNPTKAKSIKTQIDDLEELYDSIT